MDLQNGTIRFLCLLPATYPGTSTQPYFEGWKKGYTFDVFCNFNDKIYVPLPCVEAREEMVKSFIPNRSSEIKTKKIAEMLEQYSGSDIKSFCKEALMRPLRRFIDEMRLPGGKFKKLNKPGNAVPLALTFPAKLEEVTEQDVLQALQCCNPSPAPDHRLYDKWTNEYGST